MEWWLSCYEKTYTRLARYPTIRNTRNPTHGLRVIENIDIDDQGQNLAGFSAHSSALIIASKPELTDEHLA